MKKKGWLGWNENTHQSPICQCIVKWNLGHNCLKTLPLWSWNRIPWKIDKQSGFNVIFYNENKIHNKLATMMTNLFFLHRAYGIWEKNHKTACQYQYGQSFTNITEDLVTRLGSNTFYQIQIQIQKFGFFKYKYKYKYFAQLCFKYKYKYKYIDSNANTNTNTNTFNQIYLPILFGSKIGQFLKSQNICSWSVFPNV